MSKRAEKKVSKVAPHILDRRFEVPTAEEDRLLVARYERHLLAHEILMGRAKIPS